MTLPARPVVVGRPPVLTDELNAAIRSALNHLDPPFSPSSLIGDEGERRYVLSRSDAPRPAVREAMKARLGAIEASLQGAGGMAAAEVYRSLCTMKAPNATDEEVAREAVGFIEGTADMPAFALREACDNFRLGRIGEGEWMPKVGQVRREAERLTAPYRRQRHELQAVLGAEIGPAVVTTPEARAANLARVAAWQAEVKAQELVASGRGMSPQEIARAKEISEAIEAGLPVPGPLPKFGPLARKALNLPDPLEEVQPSIDRFGEATGEDTWARLPVHDLVGSEHA